MFNNNNQSKNGNDGTVVDGLLKVNNTNASSNNSTKTIIPAAIKSKNNSKSNSPVTSYQTLSDNDHENDDDCDNDDSNDNNNINNTRESLMIPFDMEGNNSTNSKNINYSDNTNEVNVLLQSRNGVITDDNNNSIYNYSKISYWERIQLWLYPVNVPIELQLFRYQNIVIPACYLLVGILQGLSGPLINVLPLDLGATEAQQATVSSIRSLPASFKLLFGFVSDTNPIYGYRRKPYMIIGWSITSISMICLLLFSNLNIPARNAGCFHSSSNDDNQEQDQQEQQNNNAAIEDIVDGAPTIPFLSLCLLGFGIGFWLADVMGDSIVAEKAKLELDHQRGSLQSTCYACRFFGLMIAAPFSTYLYTMYGPQSVIVLLALLPICILPLTVMYYEQQYQYVSPVRDQCYEIWNTVCSRAVWQPMGFVYLYNIMQVGNAAWREYLVTVLHFTSCQLNLILIVAYVLLYLGVLSYKYYFISWSWRNVYIITTLLNGFFSILQVLLIYNITFGLSPFLFALGDDAFSEFISGVQFLPTTIMMVHLCPTGSEGASYAMFTTVNNSALNLSGMISTQLLYIWDVSKNAFDNNYFTGMINLTYLTTFIQVFAIVFVGLLPRYKEDLIALKDNTTTTNSTSILGGCIFLFITFISILYAILIGIINIIG